MLAIISDLHLTDGTTGASADAGAFHGFSNRLCELAMQASWRADGCYRPIKQLDLLLLGDVFDLIDSNKWLAGDIRPWHDPQTREFGPKETRAHVTIGHHSRTFGSHHWLETN